jgi:hypothetical protein
MARNSGFNTDGLLSSLTNKPEGFLLLAAGIALMMRSGGDTLSRARTGGNRNARRRQAAQARIQADDDSDWNISDGVSGGISQAAGKARDVAGKAREYVSEVTDRTVETASSYATSMSDYASQARRDVMDRSGQISESVQETVQRLVRDQPLTVAIAGLAAGAAVAALFPVTDVEDKMFGSTRQKLADAAGRAGEQLKSAGAKAGERLVEVVEERGLSREGLTEAARDVAGAFQGALSGESEQKSAASATPNGKSPGSTNGSSGSTPPVSFGP